MNPKRRGINKLNEQHCTICLGTGDPPLPDVEHFFPKESRDCFRCSGSGIDPEPLLPLRCSFQSFIIGPCWGYVEALGQDEWGDHVDACQGHRPIRFGKSYQPKPEAEMKTLPSTHCEHANEVPGTCPCPSNCYCKKNTCRWGSPGIAKPRMKGHGPECRYSKYAGRKGPCTCGFSEQREQEERIANVPPSPEALDEARPWCGAAHAILTRDFPHKCVYCHALAKAFDAFRAK